MQGYLFVNLAELQKFLKQLAAIKKLFFNRLQDFSPFVIKIDVDQTDRFNWLFSIIAYFLRKSISPSSPA